MSDSKDLALAGIVCFFIGLFLSLCFIVVIISIAGTSYGKENINDFILSFIFLIISYIVVAYTFYKVGALR